MTQNSQADYQKFLNENKAKFTSIRSSSKNWLRAFSRPIAAKKVSSELFRLLAREFRDIYHEDKTNWLRYLEKNIPELLIEIDAEIETELLKSKQKKIHFELTRELVSDGESSSKKLSFETNRKTRPISSLPGSKALELRQPPEPEELKKIHIIIPEPETKTETNLNSSELTTKESTKEAGSKQPDLKLDFEPVSRKKIDDLTDNKFPFGKGMLR